MRRILPFALVAAALALLSPAATAEPADPVQAHLEEVADDERVPGLAVAVVPLEGRARTWTVGEDGDGEEVSGSTPFLLGSVSKSFTAAAVHALVERGRLGLDDRLGELLPDHGIPDDRADDITVDELLTHTSGLTRADGLAHADRFDTEPGAIARQTSGLTDVSLARDPGSGYEYSDLNYLLLGAVVEEAGERPFAAQVRDVARGAGVDLVADPAAATTIPPGHRQVLGRAVPFDSDYDSSGTPYGYLATDLDGLAGWARAQLGSGRGLGADALEAMHTGHVDTGSGDRYGHGWRVGEVDGERSVQHTGATPGYFSHVLLLPDRERAVVVLANAYSEARAPSLAAIAADVARLEDGERAKGADDDTALTAAPFVVAGTAVLGIIAAIALLGSGVRARVLALVTAVPLVVTALLAPGLLGYSSEQLRLWAPDLGWGLWAVAAAWALVAGIALLGLVRRRGRRSPQVPDSPSRTWTPSDPTSSRTGPVRSR